jgi:hypothetical protein
LACHQLARWHNVASVRGDDGTPENPKREELARSYNITLIECEFAHPTSELLIVVQTENSDLKNKNETHGHGFA